MGYMKIPNLYKAKEVLNFKEVYSLEKIHGTSSHINWNGTGLTFFSGGIKHGTFVGLFDLVELTKVFLDLSIDNVTVYGEAYGGSCQKMKETYGPKLKFVAFEVKINDSFLVVPAAEKIVKALNLEFVHYIKVPTDIDLIDKLKVLPSVQAERNGITTKPPREGIVLRPLIEVRTNNDKRVIAKHKNPSFSERVNVPKVSDERLKVLTKADEIAAEWVTEMRLNHVIDKIDIELDVKSTGKVIKAVIADVIMEAGEEITNSKEARKAIGKAAAKLFHEKLNEELVKGLTNQHSN